MILLIDNYDSFTFNLYQLVLENSQDKEIKVFRNDKIDIDIVRELQPEAIILSPGPGHPTEAGNCFKIYQEFHDKIPFLGVCLGHQLIGHYHGCKVGAKGNLLHGKTSPVLHNNKGLFEGLPQNFKVTRYHSLEVELTAKSKMLEVTSETSGVIMGIKHIIFPSFGVQFHPESYESEYGPEMIQNFLKLVEEYNQRKNNKVIYLNESYREEVQI